MIVRTWLTHYSAHGALWCPYTWLTHYGVHVHDLLIMVYMYIVHGLLIMVASLLPDAQKKSLLSGLTTLPLYACIGSRGSLRFET